MFSVFVDLANGSSVVRNYFSGAIMLIDKYTKRAIQSLSFDNSFKQNKSWQKARKLLLTGGIIVPENENEEKKYREFLNSIRENPSYLMIHLATTTKCNLRCSYCCEKGVKYCRMTDLVNNEFLSWFREYLLKGNIKFVILTLYGGEPLVDFGRLKDLIPTISEMCKKLEIKLSLTLITNGVLLNQEKINFLLRHGLIEVQVTIDGPEDIHNNRRMGKKAQPTFAKIFSNLTHVAGRVEKTVVRVNFDSDTYLRIPELLDLLVESCYRDSITLSFHKTNWDTMAVRDCGCYTDQICSREILEDQEICNAYIYLCQQAKTRGFTIPEIIDMGPCITIENNSVVIDPKGKIYKCIEMIGRKNLEVGSLTAGYDDKQLSGYLRADYLDSCFRNKCPLIPICAGGCRSRAFLSTGNQFNLDCQKQFLEKVNNELVKLYFAEEINQAVC